MNENIRSAYIHDTELSLYDAEGNCTQRNGDTELIEYIKDNWYHIESRFCEVYWRYKSRDDAAYNAASKENLMVYVNATEAILDKCEKSIDDALAVFMQTPKSGEALLRYSEVKLDAERDCRAAMQPLYNEYAREQVRLVQAYLQP